MPSLHKLPCRVPTNLPSTNAYPEMFGHSANVYPKPLPQYYIWPPEGVLKLLSLTQGFPGGKEGGMGEVYVPGVFRFLCRLRMGQRDFPDGSMVKNLPAVAGDSGLIPGLGSSPGEGNGYSLQYSCLGNPEDREDWWAPDGTEKRRSGSSYLSKTVLSSEFSFSDFCLHYWPPFALLSGCFLNPYTPFSFTDI